MIANQIIVPVDEYVASSLSYLIIGCGCLSLMAGLGWFAHMVWFLWVAHRASATVVGYETRVGRDPEGVQTHFLHPVVEYADAGGRQHRVALKAGSTGKPPYPAGGRVEVLFRPGHPAGTMIRCFSHLWLFPAVFTAVGLFGVAFGLTVRAMAVAAS